MRQQQFKLLRENFGKNGKNAKKKIFMQKNLNQVLETQGKYLSY